MAISEQGSPKKSIFDQPGEWIKTSQKNDMDKEKWELYLGQVFIEEQRAFRPGERIANAEPTKIFVRNLISEAESRGIEKGRREGLEEAKNIIENVGPRIYDELLMRKGYKDAKQDFLSRIDSLLNDSKKDEA